MKRGLLLAVVLFLLVVLAGCGGPVGTANADKLAHWIDGQSYSAWSTFRNRGQNPERPDNPDGLSLGSPNVFATVGCNPDDLSEIETLWTDKRTDRAIASPITLSATTGTLSSRALKDFPTQTLRRVRHTSISVFQAEDDNQRISVVDFAPMGKDQNFLVRWFLVENKSGSSRPAGLSLRISAAGDWESAGRNAYRLGDRLGLVSTTGLSASGSTVQLSLGRLAAGQRASAALFITAARNASGLNAAMHRAESVQGNVLGLLKDTEMNWIRWCAQSPLVTEDDRVDDLMDSLLCLVRTHIGADGIYTGSTRYMQDYAWVRDDYWVERALLELGRAKEAKLNLDFFHKAWQKSGLASAYQIPTGKPLGGGYMKVELPHYLVLMVRDAEKYGHVDGRAYWDMVKGCLDAAAVPANGLQPMNGDETWLLAAPVRELDYLLDNSWLLIASAEYGSQLALRMNDTDRAARYGNIAYRARMALREFMPKGNDPKWYAIGADGNGTRDFSLCPEVYARGAILGVLPATDTYLENGMVASWQRLSFDRGIRTHSRSATINGGTPGYLLYAAADDPTANELIVHDLVERMTRFASATGCVWEFHDLYDTAWGGEKNRLWDSAVLLMGMTHALFDIQRDPDETYFVKKPALAGTPAPPPSTPGYNPEELLSEAGRALILQDRSPQHARFIARALLRQRNRQFGITTYQGEPPDDRSAIIISPNDPPGTWLQTDLGYYLRAWVGPPQVWVKNTGNVYADTQGLLVDLLSYLAPERERPLPFPDANIDLAARFGEAASGRALVAVDAGGRAVQKRLSLPEGEAKFALPDATVTVQVGTGSKPGTVDVTVSATRPKGVIVAVTLPAGWWLVYGRDMSGTWDRVADPISETRLPDGRARYTYTFSPSQQPASPTLTFTHLRVEEVAPPPLPRKPAPAPTEQPSVLGDSHGSVTPDETPEAPPAPDTSGTTGTSGATGTE